MVREAVELMEDEISPRLLEETNENQTNISCQGQERKGMDREKLESLVKKVHLQFGEALRKLAE